MDLVQALRLPSPARLALVGSGGKTSAMFQLARSLRGPVWITTSTHLGLDQVTHADRHLTVPESQILADAQPALAPGVTAITGPQCDELRVGGLDEVQLLTLRNLADRWNIPLLIEADGARGRPLKAPGDHEPAIPSWVDRVLVCAGLSGLGRPLDPESVHRPERFSELSGISLGETVTLDGLAKVLAHPRGGLKNIPPSAIRSLLLNQADDPEQVALAGKLARRLIPLYSEVVIASLRARLGLDWADPAAGRIHAVHTRVAGIVLAAGESKRLGRAKQTLEWRGEPLVRQVAWLAIRAGLSPVVVVTGAGRDAVEQAVSGLAVTCATNPEWALGQSSSLQAGLRALPPGIRAALFLLCDQPQIPVELTEHLVNRHARTLAPCVVPWVGGRRANPVLFDCAAFPDLLALEGDTGGRAVFSKYAASLEKVPWSDETILLDIDTEEDYRRLLAL
ncbi:MAG TPA: selenium cofactor biosynthesis protein YqeC [Anaerolineaceae bacterium]|nr:selenium cofactor biosynthesis protein YqeC [Anaerolineaceae bacterium]